MREFVENDSSSVNCRVWINMERVKENLARASADSEPVTEVDVHEWLFTLGFEDDGLGAWYSSERVLRHLSKDEILRIEHAA